MLFRSHILKVSEGRPNIEDALANKEIDMLINTSDNKSNKDDAKQIRIQVLRNNIPYFTTLAGAEMASEAIKEVKNRDVNLAIALQDYLKKSI